MNRLAFCLLLVGAAACGDKVCTLQPRYSVVVDVVDSVTNVSLAHRSSLIVDSFFGGVYDSVYHEASNPNDSLHLNPLRSGHQYGGTFEVRVRRAGYQTWTKKGVRVEGDDCGASYPALLVARLQR
jgi:hypothetical protein